MNKKDALEILQPLLTRRDPAAQRTHAFVLALTGDRTAASRAIEAIMPGASARFDPFFRFLPNLSTAEKASAVHLGIFPDDASTRVARATVVSPPVASVIQPRPPSVAPSQSVQVASNNVAQPNMARGGPPAPSTVRPSFSLPSATLSAAPTTASPAQIPPQVASDNAAPTTGSEGPAFSIAASPSESASADESRLTGIDKLLATIAEAPTTEPTASSKAESSSKAKAAKTAKEEKAAAAKKAAEKKKRDEKLAAEKKAKEEAEKLGIPGTNWVQLAGGSRSERMVVEYGKLKSKAGSLLSRPGYVTGGKDYFRLLVGPFEDKGAAQVFVNKLAKTGVDGFSWTRTPAQIRIEKLPSK
jgi:hypothetical protein